MKPKKRMSPVRNDPDGALSNKLTKIITYNVYINITIKYFINNKNI